MKPSQNHFFAFFCFLTTALLFVLGAGGCRIFTPAGSGGIPEVQIVNPQNGDTVSGAYEIIRVQVNSGEETRKVRFFDNNLFLGEDYDAPFEHIWETAYVSNGQHELYAEAVDASGNIGRSAKVVAFVSKEDLFDWSMVNSPTSNDLFAIFAIDAQTMWACGANGTILKFEGSQWIVEEVPSGVDEDLLNIYFIDSGTGWCIGNNIMLAYENGSWSTLLSFMKKKFSALYVFDDSNGWVGDGDGILYTFDGDTIEEYGVLDTTTVTDILGFSSSDVWASCGNSVFHFDGAFWVRDTAFPGEQIHALSSFDGSCIWGVGTSLFHYDAITWEVSELPDPNGIAYDIFLSAQGTGSICGERQGVGFAFGFADTLWIEMSLQRDFPLYNLLGFANGDGWIVGAEGTILRRTAQ